MQDSKTLIVRENQDSVELTVRRDKEGNMLVTGYNVKAYGNLQSDDDVLNGKLLSGISDAEDMIIRVANKEALQLYPVYGIY